MWQPAFWRGSDDCIHWTPWQPVIGDPAKQTVGPYRFYQGRVLGTDNEWKTSEIVEEPAE